MGGIFFSTKLVLSKHLQNCFNIVFILLPFSVFSIIICPGVLRSSILEISFISDTEAFISPGGKLNEKTTDQ